MRILSISLFLITLLFSCDEGEKDWVLPPNLALKISFNDSNNFLSKIPRGYHSDITDTYVDSMVYFLDEHQNKIYDKFSIVNKTGGEFPFYKISVGGTETRFAYLSVGGKTWYIDWPNGQTDTLFANYRSDPYGPNECSCSEPLVELTINGKPYIEKTDYDINGIYIFE